MGKHGWINLDNVHISMHMWWSGNAFEETKEGQLSSLVGTLHRAAHELHLQTVSSFGNLSAPSMGSAPSSPHWTDIPTFVVNLDRSPHRHTKSM